ncbi:MAG: hypothetical protein H0W69_01870 [Gemmatimonadaceae bacterium]|nr:hypothetical protein [Gemmatimonadaceae bacterium]
MAYDPKIRREAPIAHLAGRLIVFAFCFVIIACRHKAPYVEPPPRWQWADVGAHCTAESPAFSLPAALRDTSRHPFRMGGKDPWEQKAAIGPAIPGGWGGISYRKEKPTKVVYLVDTLQLSRAIPALVSAGILSANENVGVIQGRWTYTQLFDWLRYIHTHIRGVQITSWTLDDYRNRIFYGVVDEAAAKILNQKLTEMHAPCFLVVIENTGPIHITSGGSRHLSGLP